MESITHQSEWHLQLAHATPAVAPLVGNLPPTVQAESGLLSTPESYEGPTAVPTDRRADKGRGGPQTLDGKAASRRNALKHGLSASILLPDILEMDLVQECYEALREEWQPATPTQDFLVRDTARHQAALERAEQIELAVLRRGARKPLNMAMNIGHGGEMADAILAAAGTSDAIERISRYRRQHERALLRNLAALREAKTMRLSVPMSASPSSKWAFSSEEECETYLIGRAKNARFHCPGCNGQRGKWLDSRRVWQCCECKRQVGIRAGTVLEGSRLGLLPWFQAIKLLVNRAGIPMAELAVATKVSRNGTLRKMARTIGQALASADASRRLAGLDVVFRDQGHTVLK